MPTQRNSKAIGDLAEAKCIAKFLELGWRVYIPFGDNQRCDLVIERPGESLKKVQVKSARLLGSIVEGATCSSYAHRGGKNKSYKGEVDYIAFYCPSNEKFYLVDASIAPECAIRFRLTPPKNNQSAGVRYAKDFEI